MRMFSGKCSTLALAIAAVIAMPGQVVAPQASVASFIGDSALTGGTYYWQRERDHKDVTSGDKYKTNPSHSTWSANLDSQSGYAADTFGPDITALTAIGMAENGGSDHPNEIAFSPRNKAYDEDYSGDKSSISLYKAAAKLKYDSVWARAGYIQPTGQTLLVPHWSSVPGTYRGVEVGVNLNYGTAGTLSFSYMWTNEYEAPWRIEMDDFYQNDKKIKVDYLHSVGAKCDSKNDLVLEAVFGQAQGHIDQYFAKASYKFDTAGVPLSTSYQLYGTCDKVSNGGVSDIHDSIVWLQALTFGYKVADVLGLHLEGTWVKADGQQGYSLQCMMPIYASSSGRLGIWWDSRSDLNADGEKAVLFGTMYDMKNWDMPGWALGASYVYAWDAKPRRTSSPDAYYDLDYRLKESACSLDTLCTVQEGRVKGILFKLHLTQYDNHSDTPSWNGDYGNILQDERNVKFMVIILFTIF